MAQITITEALARIKTIDKQLDHKAQFITEFMLRQDMLKDPLEREGGSLEAIKRERQSVNDLLEQKVKLRRAIQEANLNTPLTIEGTTRSFADWLTWRRECAPRMRAMIASWRQRIVQARQQAVKHGAQVGEKPTAPVDVVVFMSERDLAAEGEYLEKVLGTLDGALSLKNATSFIAVAD